jgi:cytochrome c nitrite reductase small subunit
MMKLLWSLLSLGFVAPAWRPWVYGVGGAFAGLGVLLVYVSNATSYLSDDPKACINCHIMTPQYATWERSSHARVTNCNDCHVPHDSIVRKYMFKAKDGMRHSAMFTLRMEPQVIKAIPESKEVIQANCIRCHSQSIAWAKAPMHSDWKRACTDCHREVPHGRVHSLNSTPNAAVPGLSPVTPGWFRSEKQNGGTNE